MPAALPGGSQAWLFQWITSVSAHHWVSLLECLECYWYPAVPKCFAPRTAQGCPFSTPSVFPSFTSREGDLAGIEGAVSKSIYQGLPSPARGHLLISLGSVKPTSCLLTWLMVKTSFGFQKRQPGGAFELPRGAFAETWCIPGECSQDIHLPLALPLWTWCPWFLQRFSSFLSLLRHRTVHWTAGRRQPSLESLPYLLFQRVCSCRWLQSLFIGINVVRWNELVFTAFELSPVLAILPSEGKVSPLSTFNSVVFPASLWPSKAVIWPS